LNLFFSTTFILQQPVLGRTHFAVAASVSGALACLRLVALRTPAASPDAQRQATFRRTTPSRTGGYVSRRHTVADFGSLPGFFTTGYLWSLADERFRYNDAFHARLNSARALASNASSAWDDDLRLVF